MLAPSKDTSALNGQIRTLARYRGMYVKRGERERAGFFCKRTMVAIPFSSRNKHQQLCNCHELIGDDRVTIDKAIGATRAILEFFLYFI